MASPLSTTITTPSLGSDTSPPPCEENGFIEWPDVSPIQGEDNHEHDESVDVEVLNDAIVTALSTRSEVGTPPTACSYTTPTRENTPGTARHPPAPFRAQGAMISNSRQEVSPSSSSPHYDVAVLLQQSWRRAIRVLRANPSLMTRAILCLALKQRPPVYVVDWMLRLNPEAAAAAPPPLESGPSPLFVAVQQGCSVAVVETVLRACPQALVARPVASRWDPVALAKRERAGEKDLLALLHRPVSYWLNREQRKEQQASPPPEERNWPRLGAQKRKTTVIPEVVNKGLDQVRQKLVMSPRPSPRLGIEKRETAAVSPESKPAQQQRQAIPSLLHRTRPLGTSAVPTPSLSPPAERSISQLMSSPTSSAQSSLTATERQELENVKFLCLALLKAHRRMLENHQAMKPQTNAKPNSAIRHLDESERQALLQAMAERQAEQNRICLIALDMKEKSIRALASRLEERLANSSKTNNHMDKATMNESHQVSAQLRSSYVHLYRRFLGLEEELQRLKEAATVANATSSSSASETDSCQAVFDPRPAAHWVEQPRQPRMVYTTTTTRKQQRHHQAGGGATKFKSLDDTQSLFSADEETTTHGECSKSCLRWASSLRFRSSSSS